MPPLTPAELAVLLAALALFSRVRPESGAAELRERLERLEREREG
jgi:hypothetical protein